jgi:hypothetical protein
VKDNMPDPDIDGDISRWQRKEKLRGKRRELQHDLIQVERELESMDREDTRKFVAEMYRTPEKGGKL